MRTTRFRRILAILDLNSMMPSTPFLSLTCIAASGVWIFRSNIRFIHILTRRSASLRLLAVMRGVCVAKINPGMTCSKTMPTFWSGFKGALFMFYNHSGISTRESLAIHVWANRCPRYLKVEITETIRDYTVESFSYIQRPNGVGSYGFFPISYVRIEEEAVA